MLASIFVVILILIYVQYLKKTGSGKNRLEKGLRIKNTALIFYLTVTIAV